MKKIMGMVIVVFVLCSIFILLVMSKKSENNKFKIVTSFYPLYFFTTHIVGDKAVVTNLTPPGAEPHEYEPTAFDIASIQKARLLVLNGNHLEPWGDRVAEQVTKNGVVVIKMNSLVKGGGDPHIWLSPVIAQRMALLISEAIIKIDPLNTKYYEVNTQRLLTKLMELHSQYKRGLQSCTTGEIVTSHDAFSYLANEYGLVQVAIAGISPDEEPSSKRLIELTDMVKKKNINYIFFETLVSPKLSEVIAIETGAHTLILDPIEGISEDMRRKGVDYISLMKDNLTNLHIALGCK